MNSAVGAWWAYLAFTRMNIAPTILGNQIEDHLEFWKSSVLCSMFWRVRVLRAAATVSGIR